MAEMEAKGEEQDRPWQSYNTVYTNAKAGMDGVDKERVQKIVYEMSKGSKYFENEKRKEASIQQRVDSMRSHCENLTKDELSHFEKIADKRVLELEATRNLSRIWMHVDMDAFYAAVEMLENPSLRGKPLAVGSMSMICTANYEARRFGVRAAMPGFIARKLCPELSFVPPDFKKYQFYSDLARKVFQRYDPHFIATSLDEAYLDVTVICKEQGMDGREVAEELCDGVYKETGLTCSAGVAPNRLLAKVCSDINKPNGQFVLQNDRMAVMTFISSLPIRKIGGIGKVTEQILKNVLGITTCEELQQKRGYIYALFPQCSADFFLSVGLGLGKTGTPQYVPRKSMSSERTFSATSDETLLFHKLEDIAETLSNDMKKDDLYGRTLTLKIKTSTFEVRTRAVSLQRYVNSKEDILCHASKLLKAELPGSLRLIGLRMSQFNDDRIGRGVPIQRTLEEIFNSVDSSSSMTLGSNRENINAVIGCHELNANVLNDSFVDDHGSCLSNATLHSEPGNIRSSGDLPDFNHLHELEHYGDGLRDNFKIERNESSSDQHFESTNQSESNSMTSLFIEEPFCWIDDYRCSLCGVELPPDFLEERQEHSDYHLAAMIQREESGHFPEKTIQKKRLMYQPRGVRESMRKKSKHCKGDGRYLPIDVFFTRGKQSLSLSSEPHHTYLGSAK
ncbi:hypothetical protein AMTRI_Chr12g271690 [Amborella trichopoda]